MIGKILVATINYDHPQRGLLHALSGIFGSGNVLDFDYLEMMRRGALPVDVNAQLVDAATGFKPDWIWLQVQNTGIITAEAIAEIRKRLPQAVVTNWMGDMRPTVSEYLASICRVSQITMLASLGQMHLYREAGAARVEYLQHGLDWEEDVMGLPPWEPPFQVPEVVFLGHHYGTAFPGTRAREESVLAVAAAGFNVGVVGRGWPADFPVVGECRVKEQHHVYRRAKVALNTNNFVDVELYYGDRPLIAMGSGCALVTHRVAGLEREFKNGVHCSMFGSSEELVANVRWLLNDDGARERLARAGRAEAIRNHTWFSRIPLALGWVEEEAAKA